MIQIWCWYHDSIVPLLQWKLCKVVKQSTYDTDGDKWLWYSKLNSYDDQYNDDDYEGSISSDDSGISPSLVALLSLACRLSTHLLLCWGYWWFALHEQHHQPRHNYYSAVKKIKIVNCNFHNQITDQWFQNRSQIFVSGTGSDFSEVRKSSKSGFFSLSKRALLVPETKIWGLFWYQLCDVVTW